MDSNQANREFSGLEEEREFVEQTAVQRLMLGFLSGVSRAVTELLHVTKRPTISVIFEWHEERHTAEWAVTMYVDDIGMFHKGMIVNEVGAGFPMIVSSEPVVTYEVNDDGILVPFTVKVPCYHARGAI